MSLEPSNASLRSDQPLACPSDDLLGVEPLAEALAALVEASPSAGLLATVRASRPGAGRTSFLALLFGALRSRGVACARLPARGAAEAAASLVPPDGRGCPVLLLDDATPDSVATVVVAAPRAQLVAAWACDVDAAQADAVSPLDVVIPAWSPEASERLACRLAPHDAVARARWAALVASAPTPRAAWRLVNEACLRDATVRAAGAIAPAGVRAATVAAAGEIEAEPEAVPPAAATPRLVVATPASPPARRPRRAAADPETTVDDLAAQLHSPSERVRASACAALARAAGPEATATALDELARATDDPRPRVRLAAANALLAVLEDMAEPPRDVVPVLARLAETAREDVRQAALAALRFPGAVEALADLLRDESSVVRRHAAAALGRLGDGRAVEPLLRAHGDEDPELRRAVAASLVRLGYGS